MKYTTAAMTKEKKVFHAGLNPIQQSLAEEEMHDFVQWRDVARELCPDMTVEEFAEEWSEFCRLERAGILRDAQ